MAEPAAQSPNAFPRGTETVLIVDDEEALRLAAARMLRRFGYTAIPAGSAREALDILRRDMPRIEVVLTDLAMPEMSGAELIAVIQRDWPDTPLVLVSGSDEAEERRRLGIALAVRYLEKPWTLQQLLKTVRAALDS